jgi:hypothetical protein
MRFVTGKNVHHQISKPGISKKIVHQDRIFYSVSGAAMVLGTYTAKIRELMGSGKLEWTQVKINGKLFDSGDSLVKLKKERASESGSVA